MTTFPALQPSSRSMKLGAVPTTVFKSMSGKESRIIHANKPTDHALSLSFENRSGAEGDLIVKHWNDRLGTVLGFELSPAVWAGWPQYADAIEPAQKWRYANPPTFAAVAPDVVSISVELVGLS